MTHKRRNFCDINPVCFAISVKKEILKKNMKDLSCNDNFAKDIHNEILPNIVSSKSCNLIKRGKGIDPVLQENKAINIEIACSKINGIIVHPKEVFSFWKTVGKITRKKGYKDGRVIVNNKLQPGIGGGLCNLANTINWLVLHSPLDIVEFHKHSDALAPDEGKRVPLSAGTSVDYNYIDYRFRNNTEQDIQILVWCENERLYAELRSEKDFPYCYELIEEGHCFKKENGKYYRVSKIFRKTINKKTNELLDKELIWDNHSEVMYDYDLIPKDSIEE